MIRSSMILSLVLTALLGTGTAASADGRDPVWPLAPRPQVVHGFAPPDTAWGAGHRGVDLAGRAGQTVRAAKAGTVSFAGRLAGRGVVVVRHGDTRTTYEPVSASVRVGEQVGTGAAIGRLQLGRSHCFPRACLHWGLLRGTTYLNPLTLVGGSPVRLYPPGAAVGASRAGVGAALPRTVLAQVRPWGVPVGRPLATVR